MKIFRYFTLFLVLVALCSAEKKKQELKWETGTLLNVSMSVDKSYHTRLETGLDEQSHPVLEERRNDATFYEIESGGFVYVAKRTLSRSGDKQLKVTTGGTVKFAFKGDDFILMDDEGKSHTLTLEEKRV